MTVPKDMFSAFSDEFEKIAFDWHKFREGLVDEGIPLGGATIGAAIGARSGAGLRGAALGYAAGGTASLARSYAKGEKPSTTRKLLAGGALGYGVGGGAHHILSKATKGAKGGLLKKMKPAFHKEKTFLHGLTEEGLPAIGATLGTGIAMGTSGGKSKKKTANIKPLYGASWAPGGGGSGGATPVPSATSTGAQFGVESQDRLKGRILRERQAGLRAPPPVSTAARKAVNYAAKPGTPSVWSRLSGLVAGGVRRGVKAKVGV
jgi:hypothetical protein